MRGELQEANDRASDLDSVVALLKRVRPLDGDLTGLTYGEVQRLAAHGYFNVDGDDLEDEHETLRKGGID